jgi:putative intracellular protease/amidase
MKTLMVTLAMVTAVQASAAHRVLVVFSSETKITVVKDRATGETSEHPTGFFLSELMVPLRRLIAAGYTPSFASPKGGVAVMDKVSDGAFWFGGNEREYRAVRAECEGLGLCGTGLEGTRQLVTLAEVRERGLDEYAAILVPGGHAPMEDLLKDADLGAILREFHAAGKPTALICHAPVALLSARDANGWVYSGYRMTAFSTKEEKQEEPGEDNVLGGFVKQYPDEALDAAGGRVVVRARKWQSNVVVDRELITGQNPFSDHEFADALLKSLSAGKQRSR